ncbi:MAG: hypothetical protein OET79_05080, partial [Nitrospirota bacterium]|nr:hypothetical protein [Nitrospirota bacterium]
MNALVALLPPTLPGIEPVLPTLGTGEAGDLFAALLAGQLTAPPPALPATLPATPAFEAEAALPPSAARSDMPALFDSATETPEASFRTHHWLDSAGPNPAAPDDQIDQAAAADRPVTASPVAPGGPMAATDLAADPVSHPRDAILPLDADGQPRPTVPVPVMPSAIALGAPTLPPAAEALPILPVDASAARIAPAKRIQPAPTAASAATASSAPVDDPDVATSPRPDRTATAAGSEPLPRPAPDLGPALRPDPRLGPKPDVRPDQAPTSIATRVEPRTASSAGTGQPALADLQIEPTIEVREGPITTRTERAAIETAAP